jgi:nucleoside-diphosphate-sugar epimerase
MGDGGNHLALIHIDDVVSAYMLADSQRKGSKNVYNISDGADYTQQGMLNLVADMLKVERPSRHISALIVKLLAKRRNLTAMSLDL